jgi:hypothetical protein
MLICVMFQLNLRPQVAANILAIVIAVEAIC